MTLIKYKATSGQLGRERLGPVLQVQVREHMPPRGVATDRTLSHSADQLSQTKPQGEIVKH